ncbi:MAG: hypothetical protein EHM65_00615 [Acidobacteriales bacterium]|nr:MAG: hypothetical protein EHM65_00615 [Terriglobales bacterium]
MQKHRVIPPSYHFRRSKDDGFIEVLNEGFYVMAEYSERTGEVKWQRVVLASQRERIEEWLGEHYPIQTRTQLEARRRVAAHLNSAAGRSASGKSPQGPG